MVLELADFSTLLFTIRCHRYEKNDLLDVSVGEAVQALLSKLRTSPRLKLRLIGTQITRLSHDGLSSILINRIRLQN